MSKIRIFLCAFVLCSTVSTFVIGASNFTNKSKSETDLHEKTEAITIKQAEVVINQEIAKIVENTTAIINEKKAIANKKIREVYEGGMKFKNSTRLYEAQLKYVKNAVQNVTENILQINISFCYKEVLTFESATEKNISSLNNCIHEIEYFLNSFIQDITGRSSNILDYLQSVIASANNCNQDEKCVKDVENEAIKRVDKKINRMDTVITRFTSKSFFYNGNMKYCADINYFKMPLQSSDEAFSKFKNCVNKSFERNGILIPSAKRH